MLFFNIDQFQWFESEPVIWLVGFSSILVFVLVALNVVFFHSMFRINNHDKRTAYECGFTAFDDARIKFDVRYYLVSILFLLFDIELIFLFPWSVLLPYLTSYGFWIIEIFMILITVGFIFEYAVKALDWETI